MNNFTHIWPWLHAYQIYTTASTLRNITNTWNLVDKTKNLFRPSLLFNSSCSLTLRGGTLRTWNLSPLLRKGCGETWNGCWCWRCSVTRGLFSQLVRASSWVREDFLLRLSGLWSARVDGGSFIAVSCGPTSTVGFITVVSTPGLLGLLRAVTKASWVSFLLQFEGVVRWFSFSD